MVIDKVFQPLVNLFRSLLKSLPYKVSSCFKAVFAPLRDEEPITTVLSTYAAS